MTPKTVEETTEGGLPIRDLFAGGSHFQPSNMWKIFKTYADYHEGDKGRYKAIHEANSQAQARLALPDAEMLSYSHANTSTTVLPHQQVDDSGDALTMP